MIRLRLDRYLWSSVGVSPAGCSGVRWTLVLVLVLALVLVLLVFRRISAAFPGAMLDVTQPPRARLSPLFAGGRRRWTC